MEDQTQILPVIDLKKLQEKANEAAMKGAMQEIEDFYSGYSSPYRKAIKAAMENKGIDTAFDIPDIIATINESLTTEVDKIANSAVAKSFVPMLQQFLTRQEREMKFSDILKEFIETSEYENPEDLEVEVQKHEQYDWLDVTLTSEKTQYRLTLHTDYASKKEEILKYQILGLPYETEKSRYNHTMKVSLDGGVSIEMPFTKDILKDKFMTYLARVIISDCRITMDTTYFNDSLFPEPDHCHC